jgi:hypothetical protein
MPDEGYVSYDNYEIGVMDYHIIFFIFTRENIRLSKVSSRFNYLLEVYEGNEKLKKILEDVVVIFKTFIKHWKLFKPIRASIYIFSN